VSRAFQYGNRTTHEILWLHIARSAADEDHHRAVAAVIRKPPSDWKRPPGRPNHTWLSQSHRIGPETTKHRSFLRMEEDSLSRTLAFVSIRVGLCREERGWINVWVAGKPV